MGGEWVAITAFDEETLRVNREQVLVALRAMEPERLIGVQEDIEVEFKREPYRLDHDRERFELAKDVSALANSGGGVIVIGVATERLEEALLDEATELRLLPAGLVDVVQCEAVIGERVYPRLQGLAVRFFRSLEDDGRGLVAIDVPPQREDDKPFLVQKPISDGETAPGWLVGIAFRSVGRVEERRVSEIHETMHRGSTVAPAIEQLTEVVERLAQGRHEPDAADPVPAQRLPEVIDRRVQELECELRDDE